MTNLDSSPPPPAPAVHFAVDRANKRCAVFFAGDEYSHRDLPVGWEPINPREVLTDEREFEAWLRLDLYDRLRRICPQDFEVVEDIHL